MAGQRAGWKECDAGFILVDVAGGFRHAFCLWNQETRAGSDHRPMHRFMDLRPEFDNDSED